MSVNAIEKATGSLEVLIRLYFQGPTQKSQLFGELRLNHETFAKTLRTLRDLGLVQCEAERFFPYRHLCGLANVGKHAKASSATVEVSRRSGDVVVEIVDDGIGGADTERGSGLRGLADRVEALGGRLRIWSPDGGGTRVRAEVPCAS